MSTSVGQIHYDLDLNTQGFDKAVTGVGQRLGAIGDKMQSVGRGMSLFVTAPILLAGGAAVKAAADMEQWRVAFDTMLGSAERGGKMLQEIKNFAKVTPFTVTELVEGSKRLLAFNISAEKIIPTLDALGNISAGVGRDKLPQLILAFGQVRAAGKLTGMELRQFTEAGVPLLDELAKIMGKSASQIKDDMDNGLAPSFAQTEQALFNLSAEGGRFHNLMQKQSKTTAGQWSNFQDKLQQTAAEVGAILLPLMSRLLESLSKMLGTFTSLSPETQKVILIFLGIAAAIGPLLFVMGTLIQSVQALGVAFTFIAAHPVILIIGAIIAAVAALSFVIYQNRDAFMKLWSEVLAPVLMPALITLWNTVQTQLIPALQRLWTQLSPILVPALKVLGGLLLGYIVASIVVTANVLNMLVGAISGVIRWVSTLISYWSQAGSSLQNFIRAVAFSFVPILNIGGMFYNAGRGLFEAFASGIRAAAGGVIGAVQGVLSRIRQMLPFSDAKIGPLSDLTLSGQRMVETLAKGVTQARSDLEGAMAVTLTQSQNPIANQQPMGGATSIYGNVNINSQQDADYFFNRLNRTQDFTSMGVAS